MPEAANGRLERVLAQLRLYEHPLLNFSARVKGDTVEVIIQFKDESIPVHTYYFDLHPRDLDDPQFEWSFQRQLYDALHDYFVEMFIRTPQDRLDRHKKGLWAGYATSLKKRFSRTVRFLFRDTWSCVSIIPNSGTTPAIRVNLARQEISSHRVTC